MISVKQVPRRGVARLKVRTNHFGTLFSRRAAQTKGSGLLLRRRIEVCSLSDLADRGGLRRYHQLLCPEVMIKATNRKYAYFVFKQDNMQTHL